jgi:selenocysteine lyase/cysteine desulfurase
MYTEEYNRGARRFDMGERSNFALLPAAERALMQVLEWGIPEISETLGVFSRELAMLAGDLGFSTLPEHLRAPHYLCLRREAGIPASMSEILAQHKVFVSVRGTSVRVTPHVYNCCEDIHRLISCLRIIS